MTLEENSDLIRTHLAEAGVPARQIERFLEPRKGRLRPPANITNRPLYDLLRGVYREIPAERKIDEIDRWVKSQGAPAEKFRADVHRRLEQSGLAQALPGGMDMLPDFYAALPGWSRPWFWFNRPRNFYQLGRHFAKYIEWYLNPAQRIMVPIQYAFLWPVLTVGLHFSLQVASKSWPQLDVATPVVVISYALALAYLVFRKQTVTPLTRYNVERIEAYLYLSREYSAAVAPEEFKSKAPTQDAFDKVLTSELDNFHQRRRVRERTQQ